MDIYLSTILSKNKPIELGQCDSFWSSFQEVCFLHGRPCWEEKVNPYCFSYSVKNNSICPTCALMDWVIDAKLNYEIRQTASQLPQKYIEIPHVNCKHKQLKTYNTTAKTSTRGLTMFNIMIWVNSNKMLTHFTNLDYYDCSKIE